MEVTLANLKQKVKQIEEDLENGGGVGAANSGIGAKKKSMVEEEIANLWSFL